MDSKNIFNIYSEHRHLYLLPLGGGTILFKPLAQNKCKVAEKLCAKFPSMAPAIENDIWEECVIEHSLPSSPYDMNAGIVSSTVRAIVSISSPSSIEKVLSRLQEERVKLDDLRDQAVIKICEAFPGYTPEQVEEMDWPVQIKRLAQAEKILNTEFQVSSDQEPTQAQQPVVSQQQDNQYNIPKAPAKDGSPGSYMPTSGVKMKTDKDGNQYIDFDAENAQFDRG